MRPALVSCAALGSILFLAACGSEPPPPPAAPINPQQPGNLLTVATDPQRTDVGPLFVPLDTPEPDVRPERETFAARVVPGMERVTSLASSDVALCALTDDKPPVCVSLGEATRFVPGPTEPLRKWIVADAIDCRLSMKNELDCFGLGGSLSLPSVQDFVVADDLHIYTLARGGAVTLTHLVRTRKPRTRTNLFRNAVAIHELGGVSACARSSGGQVTCADERAAFDQPVNVVRGIVRATHLAPGFVRDDSGTLFGIGEAEAGVDHAWGALRLGSGIVELAAIGAPAREVCVSLTAGTVRCRPTPRGEAVEVRPSDVTLPRAAKRFHPAGAPCVELQNGTVACWGAQLERLERLGLRVLELSPGAIAPG